MILDLLKNKLLDRVDSAPLVTLRVSFGLLLLWDIYRYFNHGWIKKFFVDPDFMFKYYGFSWVTALPGNGMYYIFALLAFCCVLIILGLFYRLAIITFTLGFIYIFLLDQARYLNHFYLVIIFSTLLCFIPAHSDFSLDSKFFSNVKNSTVPKWTLWVVVLQLEIVLIYAGLVKLNPDWLQLEPLRMWLDKRTAMPFVGQFFAQDWAVALGAYSVIALHLIGAPLLLWKPTRIYVFCVYCGFHVLNHFVFDIGIFPWLTIAATTLLFSAESHRRFWNFVLRRDSYIKPVNQQIPKTERKYYMAILIAFFCVWFSVQIFFPLRHWVYPGDVAWNEEGHRFSWRMKLRDKKNRSQFYVQDGESGERKKIKKRSYLTRKQARLVACHPDLLIQFAHHLKSILPEERGYSDPRVYVDAKCSLNGREYTQFVQSDVDISKLPRTLKHNEWILPLEVELDQRRPDYQRVIDKRLRNSKRHEQ